MTGLGLRAGAAVGGLGVVGLLALAVKGITNGAVRQEMRMRAALLESIPALMAEPKNAAMVAALNREQVALERELAESWAAAKRINQREPLLPDMFPAATQVHRRVRFVELHRGAVAELARRLHAGAPATPEEIEMARQDLAEALAWREADRERVTSLLPKEARRHGARENDQAVQYANVAKARRLRCYVDENVFAWNQRGQASGAPSVEELWFGQVELWIQQDVVAAIAELDDEVASAYGTGVCVEQMPVKRIREVCVLGYQLRDGLLLPPTRRGTGRERDERMPVSFTRRACDADLDVVVFRVAVVMDQRDVLQLIDRIGKQNFYQCTAVAYEAVGPAEAAAGYLYGTEPATQVVLEFEAYMWREVYEPLIPVGVREMLEGG